MLRAPAKDVANFGAGRPNESGGRASKVARHDWFRAKWTAMAAASLEPTIIMIGKTKVCAGRSADRRGRPAGIQFNLAQWGAQVARAKLTKLSSNGLSCGGLQERAKS